MQVLQSDLERLSWLSWWAIAHLCLSENLCHNLPRLIKSYTIFCVFSISYTETYPKWSGSAHCLQELVGQKSSGQIKPCVVLLCTNNSYVLSALSLELLSPRAYCHLSYLDNPAVTVWGRTQHWTISSYGNYLSFRKATQEPRTVIVDAESRDSPILGPNSSAAQTQSKGLVLV